jgi:hypothetical protein
LPLRYNAVVYGANSFGQGLLFSFKLVAASLLVEVGPLGGRPRYKFRTTFCWWGEFLADGLDNQHNGGAGSKEQEYVGPGSLGSTITAG